MKWVALNRERVRKIPFSLFVPEGAPVGVAVSVVGGGTEELLIELRRGEVAQGVVKSEEDNLWLLVALLHFLLDKFSLVSAAEAIRQFAHGYITFGSFRAGLGRNLDDLGFYLIIVQPGIGFVRPKQQQGKLRTPRG